MLPHIKSRGLIVIITDMSDNAESMRRAFEILTLNGHKVLVFHVYDPEMYRLPKGVDFLTIVNPSTGKSLRLNVKDPRFRKAYEEVVRAEEERRNIFVRSCRGAGLKSSP